jgi:hypothetical protein
MAEYARNGLAKGEDFEGLKEVRGELDSLNDKEMEQVVELLKQAAGDPAQMAKAYAGQKDISVRLKQMLAAHQRQEDIDAVASAVRQLADRQSANLEAASDATRLAAQDKSASGQAAVAASEQAQQSEEAAIGQEVKLVTAKLTRMEGDANSADAAGELDKVGPEAAAGAEALSAGRLSDAVTAEQEAREQLEGVARSLAPAASKEEAEQRRENQDEDDLGDLAQSQRALLARTNQLGKALAKATSAGQQNQAQDFQAKIAAMAGDEAALAAKAQMVRDDLQKTAKQAGTPMSNALTQMNSAQEALSEGDGEQAAQEERDAATQLDAAQGLAEQGSASQAQAAAPAGRQQQLQALEDGVKDLTSRETASMQQGDALKTGAMAAAAAELQKNLAGQAQALQRTAADQAAGSAPALGQAAAALQNAGQLMQAGGEPTIAEAAQQSALQNLAQAGQQLAQQAAAAAQEKEAQGGLEKEMAGLGVVIQEQRQLDLDTEWAVDAGKGLPWKARQFAHRQEDVQRNAQAVRQAQDAGSPEAAKALDKADAAMGDATQKLSDALAQEAEPPQQAALAALYQAQDALADRAQATARDMGQPAAAVGAQALAALGKAQAQTAAGQAALSGSATKQAAARLDQAARQAAQAAAQPQQVEALPQDARDALRAAEQALGSAAAAAATGQSQPAQEEAAKASQALAAAQSAIAGAQAGIAGLSAPDGQAGPADAQPGQNPGQAQQPGAQPGQGAEGAKEKGWNDAAGAAAAGTQRVAGAGAYLGLPDRDRAAIEQSQAEKYPQEYGPMIEEYMRSLATDAGGK